MVHKSCMAAARRCESNGHLGLLLEHGLISLLGLEDPLVASTDMIVSRLVQLFHQFHQPRLPVRLSYTYRIRIHSECDSCEQSRHVNVMYIYTANM